MAYTFDGSEGEQITSQVAASMKGNYQGTAGIGAREAIFFGKDLLNDILDQTGCMGIRFYFAKDDDEKMELVLVGVDANGADIDDGIFGDRGSPCPPFCTASS
ncbi:MAG: hypothetical protein GY855_04805 [candidate division Zixibacteria bacterium]|nr:hypothetical protein [candidate division Zixibacteria bacterium]